jgi:hypothetical protein
MKTLAFVKALLAALLVALCLPASNAQARDTFDPFAVMDKLCKLGEPACGPYDDVARVMLACFKNQDEIDCALAVAGATGNTSVGDAKNLKDLVVACIKSDDVNACIAQINQKYPTKEGQEAAALVKMCSAVGTVDDAIVCAHALLDSSFAAELGVTLPSWVESLFDIYMDIKTKDYINLIYHVGATVACIVANVLTGFDVCGLFGAIADLAGAIYEGAAAVVEFFSDLLGGGGGTRCFTPPGDVVCGPMYKFVLYELKSRVGAAGMVTLLASGQTLEQARKFAFDLLAKMPVWATAAPTEAEITQAWLLFMKDVGPLWDQEMKKKIASRDSSVGAWASLRKAPELDPVFQSKETWQRTRALDDLVKGCLKHVEKEDAVIAYWMKEGGAKPIDISKRQRTHCEFRIAEKLLASNVIDVCTVKADIGKERIDASCNGGNAMDVCKVVEAQFGSDQVTCGFGKGGEKGSAQTALLEMAMALGKQGDYCTMGMAKGDPNALHCPDPLAQQHCVEMMKTRFSELGWPKAGVAECKVVPTPKRVKAVEDAAKIAAAAPGVMAAPTRTGPSLKAATCGPNAIDPAVVGCTRVPTAAQVAAIQAKVPGAKVALCDRTPAHHLHWLDAACISSAAAGDIGSRQDLIAPTKPPIASGNMPGKGPVVIPGTSGGSGPAVLPGTKTSPLDNKRPAKPPGVGSSLTQPGK